MTKEKYSVARLLIDYSFATSDSSKLLKFPVLVYGDRYNGVKRNTSILKYSAINYNIIIFRCCKSIMLQNYIVSCIGKEDSKLREELVEIAQKSIISISRY